MTMPRGQNGSSVTASSAGANKPQTSMPNLTIDTSARPTTPRPATVPTDANNPPTTPGSSSPARPPVSPITPTMAPANQPAQSSSAAPAEGTAEALFAAMPPRQTFTHAQPNQVGVRPPPPKPIAFDENPDALALQSAIAVLQMQKRRAEGDIRALQRAKEEALLDAEGFARDLAEGRVRSGESLGFSSPAAGDAMDTDSDEDDDDEGKKKKAKEEDKAWRNIPARQDVVRCPPINWARYAIVGDSLDKLHAEQRESPDQGAPATVGPGGTYEFRAGGAEAGERTKWVGVAAPYTPGRDKLADKKAKGPRR